MKVSITFDITEDERKQEEKMKQEEEIKQEIVERMKREEEIKQEIVERMKREELMKKQEEDFIKTYSGTCSWKWYFDDIYYSFKRFANGYFVFKTQCNQVIIARPYCYYDLTDKQINYNTTDDDPKYFLDFRNHKVIPLLQASESINEYLKELY